MGYVVMCLTMWPIERIAFDGPPAVIVAAFVLPDSRLLPARRQYSNRLIGEIFIFPYGLFRGIILWPTITPYYQTSPAAGLILFINAQV